MSYNLLYSNKLWVSKQKIFFPKLRHYKPRKYVVTIKIYYGMTVGTQIRVLSHSNKKEELNTTFWSAISSSFYFD